jgi:putative lysine transport system substrate-binding protein
MERFNDLKTGKVGVKNGWRVYSSGPGIYLYQVVKNLLGIKTVGQDLLIDPALCEELSGLEFKFTLFDKKCTFIYEKNNNNNELEVLINDKKVETVDVLNKYKRSSKLVKFEDIEDNSIIRIYY